MIVACLQIDPSEPEQAWPVIVEAVARSAAEGAPVIALPELALSGFDTGDPARTTETALSRDGARISALAALSGRVDVVLVAGFAELAGTRVYNSAAVCDAGRLLGVYRKVHLWGDEPDHCTAAAAPPLVLNTSAGRTGVMISYDLEFPEWVRLAAEAGTELLTVPVNYPRYTDPRRVSEPSNWRKLKPAPRATRWRLPLRTVVGPRRSRLARQYLPYWGGRLPGGWAADPSENRSRTRTVDAKA